MNANTITIVTHPELMDHDTGGGDHPEVGGRLQVINEKLQTGRLAQQLNYVQPEPAERECILAYHTESWLFRFEEEVLSGRSYIGHPDNQVCYDTFRVALLSAGGGIRGVDLVEEGTHGNVFCAIRPPGHHAEAGIPYGFCFLNNCVVAARYWQNKYRRRRICILDFDAHHGNGIQSAFEDEDDTLYISIHEHPSFSFPGTGLEEDNGNVPGAGTICNIPLQPGASDKQVLKELDGRVVERLGQFKPEALIVAAGFDAHHLDDMSGLHYSTRLFGELGKFISSWAYEHCHGRLLSILEGGYHLPSLGESVEAYLAGLQSPVTVSPEASVGDASGLLGEHHFRHLPVVDKEGKLVGMVTDRDIRSAFPSTLADNDDLQEQLNSVKKTPVTDIMSSKTFVLRRSSTLDDAMLFFEKRTIGALPVLDEMGKVVGILSFKDLMKAWKNLFGLGEKGTFLVALKVGSPDDSLAPLVDALEELNIPFNRIIRTDGTGKEPAMIYVKVKTYNIIAVHSAIEQAGFKVHVPDDKFNGS